MSCSTQIYYFFLMLATHHKHFPYFSSSCWTSPDKLWKDSDNTFRLSHLKLQALFFKLKRSVGIINNIYNDCLFQRSRLPFILQQRYSSANKNRRPTSRTKTRYWPPDRKTTIEIHLFELLGS